MQEKNLGELIFSRIHAGPVFALAQIQENIFLRSHFLHISQILEGNYFGAYTCRACIRTRANTGKYSWRIIYVLVSCQGVSACGPNSNWNLLRTETLWPKQRGRNPCELKMWAANSIRAIRIKPSLTVEPGSSKWRFAALRFVHSQDIREIRGPNTFKTRLRCICHEIALSVTRQTCTWNYPGGNAGEPCEPNLRIESATICDLRFGAPCLR